MRSIAGRLALSCAILTGMASVAFLVLLVLVLASGPNDETFLLPMMSALAVTASAWAVGGIAAAYDSGRW